MSYTHSLQFIIKDLFETITFFENKTDEVWCTEFNEDEYNVVLNLESRKLRADSIGNEEAIPLNDWIYIGIYTESSEKKDSLIYYQKHKLTDKENTLTLKVNSKPVKAGIDPLNILIDMHPEDNVKEIKEILKEEEV